MKSTPTRSTSSFLRTLLFLLAIPGLALFAAACHDDDGPTAPDGSRMFRVRAGGDEFRMRLTDPEAIRLAMENLEGRNNKHPNGRIAPGAGGFNAPWSWHFVPDTVRMVDASIELCDGTPSYVEAHRTDYLLSGYCPWGGRIVGVE
jgi:hypothetical protein